VDLYIPFMSRLTFNTVCTNDLNNRKLPALHSVTAHEMSTLTQWTRNTDVKHFMFIRDLLHNVSYNVLTLVSSLLW
jgi:hypothetical protein